MRNLHVVPCFIGLATAVPATMVAAGPVAAQASSGRVIAPAVSGWDELAGANLTPEYLNAAVESLLEATVSELGKRDEIAEMERDYPGLLVAFRNGLRPVMQEEVTNGLPAYRASLVKLYAANLTAAEASEAARFMKGSAMRHFRAQMDKSRTLSATVDDIAADRDIAAESMEADMRKSSQTAMRQLSSADVSTIARFYRSPLGVKIAALDSSKTANRLSFANRESPETQRRAEEAVNEAMLKHIAVTDPAMAAAIRKQMERESASAN